MEKLRRMDFRVIIISFFKLFVAFLIPLSLNISFGTDGFDYAIESQSYAILGATGVRTFLRSTWIIIRYPIAFILAAMSIIFSLRFYKRRNKSYPIRSAITTTIVLSIIPIYIISQLLSTSHIEWLSILFDSPVSIGFCSLLLLLFVILPSLGRGVVFSLQETNLQDEGTGNQIGTKHRGLRILKVSSYLIALSAFLVPGVIVWESNVFPEYASSDITFIAFLLQSSLSNSSFYGFQVTTSVQNAMFSWSFLVSMLSCFTGLIFAWTVIRYIYGQGRRNVAVFAGLLSVIPLVISALLWQSYAQSWIAIPSPIVLILGLLILRSSESIEPASEDESEIRVPLSFRLRFWLSGSKDDKQEVQQDKFHNDEQCE